MEELVDLTCSFYHNRDFGKASMLNVWTATRTLVGPQLTFSRLNIVQTDDICTTLYAYGMVEEN